MLKEWFGGRRALFAWVAVVLLVLFSVTRAVLEALVVAWYGSFYNVLQSAATSTGASSLEKGREGVRDGLLQFAKIALPWAVLAPVAAFLRRHFCFGWRMALTEAYITRWQSAGMVVPEGASQRVQEDTARFSTGVELFAGKLLDGVLKLYIFAPKLIEFGDLFQPPPFLPSLLAGRAWLMWVAAACALLSWGVSALIASPLVEIEVSNQRIEAAFRKKLVLDEDAPLGADDADKRAGGNGAAGRHQACAAATRGRGVSDASGSPGSAMPANRATRGIDAQIDELLAALRRNYRALYCNLLGFEEWLEVSMQAVVILPFALGALQMFAKAEEERASLGDLIQLNSVFQTVNEVLSLPASNWADVQEFRSVVRRLREFERSTAAVVNPAYGASKAALL